MDEIGKRISHARRRNGLSQRALANRLGVTERTVYRWEKGENPVPAEHVRQLAVELGLALEDILPEPDGAAAA